MNDANDKRERKVRSLRDLPQGIEPPRDLWAGIEARIEAERASGAAGVSNSAGALGTVASESGPFGASGPSGAKPGGTRFFTRPTTVRWLAAAAMIATLAVGIWIGRVGLPGSRPAGTAITARNDANKGAEHGSHIVPTRPLSGGVQAVQAAYLSDPKYREERAALVKSLETQLDSLPPETRGKVLSSLATIHKSMQDLEAALGKDPTNALLQELLLNTYQDEMRVLTTVHEASDAGKGI
jgi:hypothetical protein